MTAGGSVNTADEAAPVPARWQSFVGYRTPRLVEALLSGSTIEQHPCYDVAMRALARVERKDVVELADDLRGEVRMLREHYRSSMVSVDYGRLARGYLVAYVPPYIQMAEHVWAEALPAPASVGHTLNVVVVGAGPAPEVVGLINLLVWNQHRCRRIEAVCLDVADDIWRQLRDALVTEGAVAWGGEVALESRHFDLSQPAAVTDGVRSALRAADVVVIQNCLNEGAARGPALTSNLADLAEALRPGARLAIADIHGYDAVRSTVDSVLDELAERAVVRREPHEPAGIARRVLGRVPDPLRRHVLDGQDGLVPRRNLRYLVRVAERLGSQLEPPVTDPVPTTTIPAAAQPTVRRRRRTERRRERAAELPATVRWEPGVAYTGIVTFADGQRGIRLRSGEAEVFIPHDHLEQGPARPLASYVGRRLSFEVIHAGGGLVKGTRRAYLARRRQQFWAEARVGARVFADTVEVHEHGVVLERHGQVIRVAKGEISHDWVEDARDHVVVGQLRAVELTALDHERMRMDGSIKRCEPDPVQLFAEREDPGVLVPLEIVALEESFACARVGTLPAWIHVSQISERFVRRPSDELDVGQQAWGRYLGVKLTSRRRGLQVSLRDVVADAPVARAFVTTMADEDAAGTEEQ